MHLREKHTLHLWVTLERNPAGPVLLGSDSEVPSYCHLTAAAAAALLLYVCSICGDAFSCFWDFPHFTLVFVCWERNWRWALTTSPIPYPTLKFCKFLPHAPVQQTAPFVYTVVHVGEKGHSLISPSLVPFHCFLVLLFFFSIFSFSPRQVFSV